MSRRWRRAVALALGLCTSVDAARAEECRLALLLGLDVSSSVDAREYRLQLDGLAGALRQPEVRAAFLDLPGAPVRLSVFEWSGAGSQRLLLDWTVIRTVEDLDRAAARLANGVRVLLESTTALGRAMQVGAGMLATQPGCWRHTLDLSGDGQSNTGPSPRDVRMGGQIAGITVNALAIGADPERSGDDRQPDIAPLWAYFSTEVIHGPGAFVVVALGFEDFQDAMARKLLREVSGLQLSDGRGPAPGKAGGG